MKNRASASRQVDRIELFDTFVRIVEAGSLSAAASRMGSTQPTISRRLSALEQQLGLKLLQRSTHAMKLTEDGERCLVLARGLLETWQAMDEGLRGQAALPQGTLRVLAPHAFGQQQLIGPVADYLQRYPGVSLEWLLNDRLPDFIAEGVDCAIRVGSVEDPSLVVLKLGQVRRVVVSAPRWLEAANPPRHPRDLVALPWMAVRTFYQDEVLLNQEATDESFSFPIRPRFSTDSLYALRHAALRGLGLGIFSRWLVEEDLAAGRLVRLLPGWEAPPLPVYLVYPYSRLLPARLSRFIELIRQAAPLAIDV